MAKAIKIFLGIVVAILVVVLFNKCLAPIYDAEETKVAIGQTYNLDDGWTIEFENGEKIENVSLPYKIPAEKGSSVTLYHEMSDEYAGLGLNFLAGNSALRIFLDGKPIFEAGFSDTGDAPDLGKMEDEEGAEDAQDQPVQEDTTSTKTVAGEITADLPSNITEGSMRIQLERVDDAAINVQYATVCKRDVAVINVLRDSMFPILCALLVLFSCVIILMLDAVRLISGERMRGLAIVAFMGVLGVAFMILQTDLMKMFFSNKNFFDKLAMLIVEIMPLFIAWFYEIGFNMNYHKRTGFMLWMTVVFTLVLLLLEAFEFVFSQAMVKPLTIFIYLFVLTHVLMILFEESKKCMGYHTVVYDIASISFFSIALILAIQGEVDNHIQVVEYVIDVLITIAMYFVLAQHASIVIASYKESVEKHSKQLQSQVEIANLARQDAITANEAKGKFLANMSHEIRTPINAVLGMDEMILRESREKNIREYAMDIHTAGQSLLSIINDILDMSKIESGKMEIVPVDYDISSMIHDLSNMISLRAKAKNLKLEVSVDCELPARLHGDDVRIKQVLTNILTNAVKYTENGTVWFRVTGRRNGENEILHFEVEDTGIGIKNEDMHKLFEAFQRIEEGRNRNIEGTGLGMNITLQMLDMMGSKLNVESEYGKGSKFFFDLKQKIVDDTPLGNFEERIKKLEQQYVYNRSFIAPDATVLVVDDNAMNRKVFSALLKPTQIKVEEAESGAEAIEKVKSQYYDIIFMDHMMPEMDGIEAMHRIKALDDFPCKGVPILVLTANAVAGAKEEYLKEGFEGFLSKPVVADKLEKAIFDYLSKEKIMDAPDDIEQDDNQIVSDVSIDNLPMVDGLDWNVAYLHLPGIDLIESACREFYQIIDLHGDKLQKMYEGLPGTLDDYRIQVHGMKSSAASIGIIPLAGMAKILEFAAKDNDIDRIKQIHDVFMKEWRGYTDKLNGVFGLGQDESAPKETLDKEALKVLLNVLSEAMEDMDIDAADDAMNKLSAVELPEDMASDIPKLKGMVADLDADEVQATVEKWLEKL